MSISEYSLENAIVKPETSSQNATQNILLKDTELSSEVVNNFYTLAAQWESEVAGLSLTAKMSEHPAYQEIINMGMKIVPLLLSELKKNPLYWLSALSEITGENPIKPEQRGRIKQMASAWIEWGKNQGYAISQTCGKLGKGDVATKY